MMPPKSLRLSWGTRAWELWGRSLSSR
jgi:hypothetical protein